MHERRFLLITLSLIVLIGAPSVYSMIQEPTIHGSSASRHVASIAPVAPVESNEEWRQKNAIKSKSVTLDFNCNPKSGKSTVQEIDGNLLRLRGNACFNDQWKNVSIINKTNGYTASVIFVNKGFTTDFMDMNDGENKVIVTGINEKGQSVEHLLTINKRAPASL